MHSKEQVIMQAMREEIASHGWLRPTTLRHSLELVAHVAVFLGGASLFFLSSSWFIAGTGLLISTIGSFGIATNTHTASHGGATEKRKWNQFLSYFGYAFIHGMSATYWHHKHVTLHHRAPNIVGIDPDMDPAPYFDLKRVPGKPLTLRQRIQWLFVPFLLPWMALGMAVNGVSFLVKRLAGKNNFRLRHAFDLIALSLHYAAFWWLSELFGAQAVGIFVVGRLTLLSLFFFAAFAPAHLCEQAKFLSFDSLNIKDRFELVTQTTVNFRASRLFSFYLSGLQFQIEHHLFPNVSHKHYAEMSIVLRELCEKHGYNYQTIAWHRGFIDSLEIFGNPKEIGTLRYSSKEKNKSHIPHSKDYRMLS